MNIPLFFCSKQFIYVASIQLRHSTARSDNTSLPIGKGIINAGSTLGATMDRVDKVAWRANPKHSLPTCMQGNKLLANHTASGKVLHNHIVI